jgi:hypothetical protein
MSVALRALLIFAALLLAGGLAMLVPIAVQRRRLTRAASVAPALPEHPDGQLLLASPGLTWPLTALSLFGYVLLFVALGLSFVAAPAFRFAPVVDLAVWLPLVYLHTMVRGRSGQRLRLDEQGFTYGEKKAKPVRWVHVSEFGAGEDAIRYRLNRALVQSSGRRYWDGTIRNAWGIEPKGLLRLLEGYRAEALENAPHYLTGRPERSH